MKGKTLPPKEQTDLLVRASQWRAAIEIAVRREADEVLFRSHLLPNPHDIVSETLRIQKPGGDLAGRLLVAGTPLRVRLAFEKRAYWFLSTFVGPLPKSQQMLMIEAPASVTEDMRDDRTLYRLRQWTRKPIPVVLWTVPDPTGQFGGIRWEGELADVGGGGIGVKIPADQEGLAQPGRMVGIFWTFPQDAFPFVLKGVIRHKKILVDSKTVRLGIQFVEAFNRTEHQATLNRLLHYIAQQERLLIQQRQRM